MQLSQKTESLMCQAIGRSQSRARVEIKRGRGARVLVFCKNGLQDEEAVVLNYLNPITLC